VSNNAFYVLSFAQTTVCVVGKSIERKEADNSFSTNHDYFWRTIINAPENHTALYAPSHARRTQHKIATDEVIGSH
jgi:hypothetical protein